MPTGVSGFIIAGLLAVLLAVQAKQAPVNTRLRLAYGLGTGAMALVAFFNLLAFFQVQAPLIGGTIIVLGLALLAGSMVAFAMALFNGELRAKFEQARSVAEAERTRRKTE